MDAQQKSEEAFFAPVGAELPTPDLQIIARAGWYQNITPSSKTALGNEVVLSKLASADAEAIVRGTIREYAEHGVPFKWCVGPPTEPADFGALLERYGFMHWDIRGMGVSPAAWTAAGRDVEVELVSSKNVDDYVELFVRGWEIELDRAAFCEDTLRAIATGRFHMFVARVDGVPAGTAGYIVKPRSGYLVGGNVLPMFRGRGIYRALIDERLRRLRELGLPLAITQAREATSAPILERLGFETVLRFRIYKLEDPRAAVERFAIT